jgi:hypothetical protein
VAIRHYDGWLILHRPCAGVAGHPEGPVHGPEKHKPRALAAPTQGHSLPPTQRAQGERLEANGYTIPVEGYWEPHSWALGPPLSTLRQSEKTFKIIWFGGLLPATPTLSREGRRRRGAGCPKQRPTPQRPGPLWGDRHRGNYGLRSRRSTNRIERSAPPKD